MCHTDFYCFLLILLLLLITTKLGNSPNSVIQILTLVNCIYEQIHFYSDRTDFLEFEWLQTFNYHLLCQLNNYDNRMLFAEHLHAVQISSREDAEHRTLDLLQ